jgi:sugar lactone lactonase YvrE
MTTIDGSIKPIITILLITICPSCTESPKQDGSANHLNHDEIFISNSPTKFEVDPFWPRRLPNNWILGEVPGVAVDAHDHVWIIQRPHTLNERELGATTTPPEAECCFPAPVVIEFDPDGNVVQAWGNPDTTQRWIANGHGIYVDNNDYVWITGQHWIDDHVVLKMSREGKQLLQIGKYGQINGSNDTTLLGSPADIAVDTESNEVYIADGYRNRRIIVFDATTGTYKRHWGAYGERPHDNELPPYSPDEEPLRSFRNPVHAVCLSNDGLVYVADRTNNRIQVFHQDGTFVTESFVAKETLGSGSVWDITLSRDPDQTYMYIADGMNMKVWILNRSSLEIIGSFGHGGRNAGEFGWIHNLAMDSKGNIYTVEVTPGKRIQKFRPVAND